MPLSHLLEGQYIELEEVDDGIWDVYYSTVRLGQMDERLLKVEDAQGCVRPFTLVYVLHSDAPSRLQVRPSLGDSLQEFWMMLQSVLEPVVRCREADQDSCGMTMASDHNLFVRRKTQVLREVVLELRERYFTSLACLLR